MSLDRQVIHRSLHWYNIFLCQLFTNQQTKLLCTNNKQNQPDLPTILLCIYLRAPCSWRMPPGSCASEIRRTVLLGHCWLDSLTRYGHVKCDKRTSTKGNWPVMVLVGVCAVGVPVLSRRPVVWVGRLSVPRNSNTDYNVTQTHLFWSNQCIIQSTYTQVNQK